ncbi:hypothetical protein AA18895_0190 [Acetobacter ghanensis DSM 18895]|nr:hypothetical protein AA18895_0190 [Acetobacter ghanensis DSM 18895]
MVPVAWISNRVKESALLSAWAVVAWVSPVTLEVMASASRLADRKDKWTVTMVLLLHSLRRDADV